MDSVLTLFDLQDEYRGRGKTPELNGGIYSHGSKTCVTVTPCFVSNLHLLHKPQARLRVRSIFFLFVFTHFLVIIMVSNQNGYDTCAKLMKMFAVLL